MPQPQEAVAFGLTTRNEAPIRSSTKSTSDPARNGTDAGSTATTVSIRDAGGGQVLATSAGHTLYLSDQEKDQVLCSSSDCEAVWIPLTLPSGEQPSAPGDLAGQLTTVPRPDGSSQVALGGQPLYTFSFDRAAGDVNGDGKSDSFDGVDFTWHAATPTHRTSIAWCASRARAGR